MIKKNVEKIVKTKKNRELKINYKFQLKLKKFPIISLNSVDLKLS